MKLSEKYLQVKDAFRKNGLRHFNAEDCDIISDLCQKKTVSESEWERYFEYSTKSSPIFCAIISHPQITLNIFEENFKRHRVPDTVLTQEDMCFIDINRNIKERVLEIVDTAWENVCYKQAYEKNMKNIERMKDENLGTMEFIHICTDRKINDEQKRNAIFNYIKNKTGYVLVQEGGSFYDDCYFLIFNSEFKKSVNKKDFKEIRNALIRILRTVMQYQTCNFSQEEEKKLVDFIMREKTKDKSIMFLLKVCSRYIKNERSLKKICEYLYLLSWDTNKNLHRLKNVLMFNENVPEKESVKYIEQLLLKLYADVFHEEKYATLRQTETKYLKEFISKVNLSEKAYDIMANCVYIGDDCKDNIKDIIVFTVCGALRNKKVPRWFQKKACNSNYLQIKQTAMIQEEIKKDKRFCEYMKDNENEYKRFTLFDDYGLRFKPQIKKIFIDTKENINVNFYNNSMYITFANNIGEWFGFYEKTEEGLTAQLNARIHYISSFCWSPYLFYVVLLQYIDKVIESYVAITDFTTLKTGFVATSDNKNIY